MVGFHFLAFTVILTALAWLSSASDLKTWCASRGTKAVYIGQTCFTTTEASQSFSANSLSCKDQQNGGLAILPSSDLIQDISSILTSETSNFHIGLGQVVTSNSDQTSDSQQKETQTSDTKASNPDASVTQIITTQIPTTTVKNRLPSKGIETEVVNPETSQILTSRRRKRSTSTNGDQTTSINGNWLWADANKNTFGQNPDIKWQTGESNVANGDQNCAAMAKSGEIVAVSCSANLRAICQYRESKMVYRLSQVGYKVQASSTAIIAGKSDMAVAHEEQCAVMCREYLSCHGYAINKSAVTCTLLFTHSLLATDVVSDSNWNIYGLF